MSGSDLRPKSYGWVDKNNVNSYVAALDIPESTSGYNDGAIPPAEKYNMVMQRHAGWAAHLDARAMRSEHIMGAAAYSRVSSGSFEYTPGAGLVKAVAADSCYVVQGLIVDLPITRLADEGLSSFTFTANKWTHFYIDKDGVSFAVVTIGVAATPGVGQKLLGTAVTNGVSLTGWAAGDAAFTDRRVIYAADAKFQGELETTGDLLVNGNFEINGTTIFNVPFEVYATDSGPLLTLTQNGTGNALRIYNTSSTDPVIDIINGSGSGVGVKIATAHVLGLWVNGGDSAEAARLVGGSAQPALELSASATSTYVARATASNGATWVFRIDPSGGSNAGGMWVRGSGTGNGARIDGGSGAGSHAILATAANSTGFGVSAATHSTATAAARALYAKGFDAAAGIEAESVASYALILTPKVAAPTVGALFATAQTSVPTSFVTGQMSYVASTFDMWGHSSFVDSTWRFFHSSIGGRCYGFNTANPQTNSNSGIYTDLITVTLTGADAPKLAGKVVLISVNCRAGTATAAAGGLDCQVRDTTAGTTIHTRAGSPGVLVGSGYYLPATAAGGEYTTSITFDFEYTIPAAGARTFVFAFKRNVAVNVTCMGSMRVAGL